MNRYLERFFDNWYCAKYRRWKKHQGKQERGNILVICRRPLGDTLLCTPFFRELKRNRPDVDIDVICSPQNYNLLEKSPYIHQFFLFDDRVKKHYYIVNLKRCWKLAGLSIVLCKFFSQPCRTYASRPTCAHPFRVGYAHSTIRESSGCSISRRVPARADRAA